MPTPDTTVSAPETFAAAPPEPATPALSVSQQNAIKSAESYLDYSAFSRQGLIDQLEYEQFSTADATYAVDHVTVDWNEQAAKSAKSYMDYSSFSRGSLIDQLEYEGFTAAQATHGADSVGL
ncbi:Ltp family lipoprotein [Pseudonocardia nematodicida]|uniref:Ltp family lipoprotein n=1 Tax=Pseudonocardia nematodicida TaxID=1206997 RepID=A0ABV1K5D3_9PSEU